MEQISVGVFVDKIEGAAGDGDDNFFCRYFRYV